jgi:tellurite resistance protein TehA-like permease
MFAVWLLPVVTLIVASSSGGVLCSALKDVSPSHALVTVTFSVAILTIGLSLALMMLTVYLLRLIVYGLPPGATIISVFLPLGPTGQAGYSLLLIGRAFKSLLPLSDGDSEILKSNSTADTINVICVCASFALWALATMWLIFALLALVDVLRQARVAFRVPFWGLIFPNVGHIHYFESF